MQIELKGRVKEMKDRLLVTMQLMYKEGYWKTGAMLRLGSAKKTEGR